MSNWLGENLLGPQGLIFLGILLAAVGGVWSARQQDASEEDLKDGIANLKGTLDSERAEGESRERSHREQLAQAAVKRDEINGRLIEIQAIYEPLRVLARENYPNLEEDSAIAKLAEEVRSLGLKAGALEQRAAPRTLSQNQVAQLVEELRAFRDRSVDVVATMGDAEAFQYAKQIEAAFLAAGWQSDGVEQVVYVPPVGGLFISSGTDPSSEEVNQVFRAFRNAGITMTGNLEPEVREDQTKIIVGTKPP